MPVPARRPSSSRSSRRNSDAYYALSAIGGYVYFYSQIAGASSSANTVVRRVHRCGGEPLTLTPTFGSPVSIRVDETYVYYGNGSSIRRVAR